MHGFPGQIRKGDIDATNWSPQSLALEQSAAMQKSQPETGLRISMPGNWGSFFVKSEVIGNYLGCQRALLNEQWTTE